MTMEEIKESLNGNTDMKAKVVYPKLEILVNDLGEIRDSQVTKADTAGCCALSQVLSKYNVSSDKCDVFELSGDRILRAIPLDEWVIGGFVKRVLVDRVNQHIQAFSEHFKQFSQQTFVKKGFLVNGKIYRFDLF